MPRIGITVWHGDRTSVEDSLARVQIPAARWPVTMDDYHPTRPWLHVGHKTHVRTRVLCLLVFSLELFSSHVCRVNSELARGLLVIECATRGMLADGFLYSVS